MTQTVESYAIDGLDRRMVLRYLGHRGQELDESLERRIDEGIGRCLELARAKASWQSFAIAERSEKEGVPCISLEGCPLELEGKSIARHLKGARMAVALAVTVGLGIDRELQKLSVTDAVAQAVLDAAGSVAVEHAADACSASIRAWAAEQGLHAGARFSPGYGDLPLDVQPELLASVDAQRRLGISLSDSLLMTPVKSVTAIVGIFDEEGLALRASRDSGSVSEEE